MLEVLLSYVKDRDLLNWKNHLGKTPLVLVAEAASTEENESIAKMLLGAGVDPKAA